MNRWLTVKEAAIELRVTTAQIKRMMSMGQLQFMRMGAKNEVRILDPAPALKQSIHEPRLERFPLITAQELAEVLGLSGQVIKWHVFQGNLKYTENKRGRLALYSPKDVRRFLALREKRKGHSKFSYSETIVTWLREFVADCSRPNGEVISSLIRDAVALLPEPERTQAISKIYGCVELVNHIIRDAKSKKSG